MLMDYINLLKSRTNFYLINYIITGFMKVVIPFKAKNPKSRLSHLMNERERVEFAKCMLFDVVSSIPKSVEVLIITPERLNLSFDREVGLVVDKRSLNDAINSLIKDEIAVIMSDLPLLNENIVTKFLSQNAEIVIAPGRKGGTNMLLIKNKNFKVSYHYGSFFKHLKIAREMGLKFKIFDSFYSSIDVDEESDLLELLLHGIGKKSWEFLTSIGFEVKFEKDPILIKKSK